LGGEPDEGDVLEGEEAVLVGGVPALGGEPDEGDVLEGEEAVLVGGVPAY
jgi:hypothetical protein